MFWWCDWYGTFLITHIVQCFKGVNFCYHCLNLPIFVNSWYLENVLTKVANYVGAIGGYCDALYYFLAVSECLQLTFCA